MYENLTNDLQLEYKMNTFKKGLLAGAAALAMSMTSQASEINVGGVTWDPETVGIDQLFTSANEAVISSIGDTLSGYGLVTAFPTGGDISFCAGCELTFEFGGYELAQLGPVDAFGSQALVFTGGWVNFYVDHSADYDDTIGNAQDGDLWLSLVGHEQTFGAFTGTLFGAASLFGTGNDNGSGRGLLDVRETGAIGMANNNFNTNSFTDAQGNMTDANFNSTFAPSGTDPLYPLSGVTTIQSRTIPEPSTIALLGLGLLGFAGARKRKA